MRVQKITIRHIRVLSLIFLLLGSGAITAEFVTGSESDRAGNEITGDSSVPNVTTPIETESDYQPENYTVITSVKGALSPDSEQGTIVLVDQNGSEVYVDSSYNVYDGVDPSPEGRWTVNYVAAIALEGKECQEFDSDKCTLNFIERLNFSTGETERLYEGKTAHVTNSRWHDADRLDEHRFVLANIANERIQIVNTTTGDVEWEWGFEQAYDRDTVGYEDENDWAHLNDVEMLENGHIMASPRNFDQVVFVKPGEGINRSMTLGEDENYDVMYEQHNPDYLTAEGEPPSVIIADSQNNRIVEFARENGTWTETWVWSDERLAWPRDSDRLPNGNTLITDTSGRRVIEVSPEGEVLWGVDIYGGYEAERLGTGPESENGPPATAVNDSEKTVDQGLQHILPPSLRRAISGILFILPQWVGIQSLIGVSMIGFTAISWPALEGIRYWRTGT